MFFRDVDAQVYQVLAVVLKHLSKSGIRAANPLERKAPMTCVMLGV